MNQLLRLGAVVLLAAAFTACAAASPGERAGAPRSNPNVISRAEIDHYNRGNAFEIIQAARPNWLTTRGVQSFSDETGDIVVYYGATQLGGLETLRELAPSAIERIEFISAATATQRWGTGHNFGAILVVPRGSRR